MFDTTISYVKNIHLASYLYDIFHLGVVTKAIISFVFRAMCDNSSRSLYVLTISFRQLLKIEMIPVDHCQLNYHFTKNTFHHRTKKCPSHKHFTHLFFT